MIGLPIVLPPDIISLIYYGIAAYKENTLLSCEDMFHLAYPIPPI